MELKNGGTLNRFLCSKIFFLEEKECRLICAQLLLIADFMHQRNALHRDLKPDNILMNEKRNLGEISVADFGLSTHARSDPKRIIGLRSQLICGTAGYLPPEVLSGKCDYTQKADIFSIGCIMYEILTGGLSLFEGRDFDSIVFKN